MIVMPGNNGGIEIGYLAGLHPGKIGWLLSPGSWKEPPPWMEYAIDNGAYGAHLNRVTWNEESFYKHLENLRCRARKPRWVAVPDVVADKQATLSKWETHAPKIASYGCTLAFVVQDGMQVADVPKEAGVVFVGGPRNGNGKRLKYGRQLFRASTWVVLMDITTYGLLMRLVANHATARDGFAAARSG